MPMTKAAVRGMDAVTEIAASQSGVNITKFMIGGASKVIIFGFVVVFLN